jgi:CubicO group peptidase (beta-lactamase class C family)
MYLRETIFMALSRAVVGVTVSALGLLFTSVAGGQQKNRSALVSDVDSIANAALKGGPIAGISVAIVQNGNVVLAKGYGYANLEHDVPSTPDTVYRIRSISKMFTAVGVLQLAEQGKLGLEDELTKFIPDYPTHGQKVSLLHLLSHTSGIKNYGGPSLEYRMRK